MTDSPFLTVESLADTLGVKVGTVREWCREVGPRSIPRYRMGKRLAFDLQEVTTWVKTYRDVRATPKDRRRRR